MCLFNILFNKQITTFSCFQESQIERQLRTWTSRFELIEQFFVIDGLRSLCKWTFYINIFNAAQETVRGHLTLIETAQRLDLARQPVRRGEDRSLPQQIFAGPRKRVSE